MGSSPVTIMSTIHPLSGEDSLVLRMRKHPGNKSINTSGANSTFLPGEHQKELDIPVIVDAYNQNKVGVNVADQYQTYFDIQMQLVSTFLLDSGDSPYQEPHNLLRSSSNQGEYCGAL